MDESKLPEHLIANELSKVSHKQTWTPHDRSLQLHEKFSETIRHQFYLDGTNSLFTLRIYVESTMTRHSESWMLSRACVCARERSAGDLVIFQCVVDGFVATF